MSQSLTLNSELNSSSSASNFMPPEETMDRVFVEQIRQLREMIYKRPYHPDVDLCRKWLKVFNKTTKKEKMARNCLCSLMQYQMQECGELHEPFTIVQNCNRDLDVLLGELDAEQVELSINNLSEFDVANTNRTISDSYLDDDYEDVDNSDASMLYVSRGKNKHKARRRSGGDYAERSKGALALELQENEMTRENIRLRRELETMRLHLTEKQIENSKLMEIANRYEMENTKYGELFENLQTTLLESIQRTLNELKSMTTAEHKQTMFRLFEKLFHNFKTDDTFVDELHKCDEEFESLVNNVFEWEFNKRKTLIAKHIANKIRKSRKKLNKRFNDRLRINKWAQTVKEKFMMLQCFSILRQIVMSSKQLNGHMNVLEILKELEDKYKSVLDEEFE